MPRKVQPKDDDSGNSLRVLEFLQRSPGQVYSPKDISDALDILPGRVSAALQYLNRQHLEVRNESRGAWSWRPEHLVARRAPVIDIMPLTHAEPATSAPTQPTFYEAVTVHRSGGTVLRDQNGDLWLAQPIPMVSRVLDALGFEDPTDHRDRKTQGG